MNDDFMNDLRADLKDDIDYDVHWSLKDLVRYVKTDLNISVTLSPKEGVIINVVEDNNNFSKNNDTCIKTERSSQKENLNFGDNISDNELIFKAQKSPCTLLIKNKIGRSFLQNSFGIPKSQTSFVETFLGQKIDNLRGEDAKIIIFNKIYFAHFTTTKSITGNAVSLRIEWPKHSAIGSELQNLLKAQNNFFTQNRNVKCLPNDLDISYEFYAINGTTAFKLVFVKE